jgi:hypothetical protein
VEYHRKKPHLGIDFLRDILGRKGRGAEMIDSQNRRLIWCVALWALSVLPASANLLTNGSFETGSFVNQGNQTMVLPVGSTTISGWTVVADQLAWINAGNPWGLSAQDGNFFLDFTAYPAGAPFGGVAQSIATVPGQQYNLSFYLGSYTQRWGGPPVSIQASAGGTSQTFTDNTTSTGSTWTPFSMLFTASSANTVVSLVGTAGYQYIGLDNVSVVGLGVGAVPEPGSFTLIGAGLSALLFAARRRRA